MRLLASLKGMFVKALAIASGLTLAAGSASIAEGLEQVGAPVPKGINFQPIGSGLARDLHGLDNMLLVIIAGITAFVLVLLVYVIVRFNRRANPTPSQFTHNTQIEVIWTILPVVILVFIGAYSLPVLFKQQEIPVGDVTIKVTGSQWYWTYEYVDDDVEFDSYMIGAPAVAGNYQLTPEVITSLEEAGYQKEDFLLATDTAVVVPVGKDIVMQVTGADVIHSWTIPAFGVKQDGVPGRLGQLWFNAEREGIYFGQCSELCGIAHSYMPIVVKVVSQEVYDKWLEAAKEGDVVLSDAQLEAYSAIQTPKDEALILAESR